MADFSPFSLDLFQNVCCPFKPMEGARRTGTSALHAGFWNKSNDDTQDRMGFSHGGAEGAGRSKVAQAFLPVRKRRCTGRNACATLLSPHGVGICARAFSLNRTRTRMSALVYTIIPLDFS